MDISQLEKELHSYLQDATLLVEVNLEGRAKALALIALLQEATRMHQQRPGFRTLLQQALALQAQIAGVNRELFQRIRTAIKQGYYRGAGLTSLLQRFTPTGAGEPTTLYFQQDSLDLLISGVLELDNEPIANQSLLPGMVHYERTPARVILALVARVNLARGLVFYDLGSGLGEVPILVHLLTGIQTKGVEIEAAFCHSAQQRLAALQINGVIILHADARTVDYSDGDIFFMFTPFYGAVLQTVLDRLHQQARRRTITLCTYGPCTPVVAQQPWLSPVAGSSVHEFALAIFRSCSTSKP